MRPPDIDCFHGPNRWLSNFWPAPVVLDGLICPTVEHAYQAAKTTDLSVRQKVLELSSPGRVKQISKGFMLRVGWDDMRLAVMRDLTWQKYEHEDLRQRLLGTGDALLIEGNTWGDRFWGVYEGYGENHLGKIIMEVRQRIRETRDLLT